MLPAGWWRRPLLSPRTSGQKFKLHENKTYEWNDPVNGKQTLYENYWIGEQVYNADHFDNFFKTLLFTNIL